jgi:hypothetical protein
LLARIRAQADTLPEAILADVRSEVFSFGDGGKEMSLGDFGGNRG